MSGAGGFEGRPQGRPAYRPAVVLPGRASLCPQQDVPGQDPNGGRVVLGRRHLSPGAQRRPGDEPNPAGQTADNRLPRQAGPAEAPGEQDEQGDGGAEGPEAEAEGLESEDGPRASEGGQEKTEQSEHAAEELSRPWTWGERHHRTLTFTRSVFG